MSICCILRRGGCQSRPVVQVTSACMRAGTAIAINMPMTVEAVIIYLGIIYAGCAAVSIADSFAPSEISTRLEIANTKAIFVQDVILRGGKAHPLYERVVKARGPTAIVLPATSGQNLKVLCCGVLHVWPCRTVTVIHAYMCSVGSSQLYIMPMACRLSCAQAT